MARQLEALRQAKKRGSAMLITMILSLAMASVVMYAVSDTMNANKNAQREDNYARALAAAEYGAELTISEIGKSLVKAGNRDTSLVLGDFVVGENNGAKTLYTDKVAVKAWEQRRIGGKFDNQDFRVQVRSARQVYNTANTSEDKNKLSQELVSRGWLRAPENASIPIGEIKAYEFQDIYEITSSAQDARVTSLKEKVGSEYQTRPVIQAVVKFDYESPLDDLLNKIGVIHQEDAARLQVTGGFNSNVDWDNLRAPRYMYFGTNGFKPEEYNQSFLEPAATKQVYNLAVSGEDHNIVKYFVNDIASNRILTPWKLSTNDQQYFGALAGYWSAGQLTLNYRHPDNRESEENTFNIDLPAKGYVRKFANPYRPATVTVGASDADRSMIVYDAKREYDSYLLGGKKGYTTGNNHGVTVTVDENAPSPSNNGVMGAIEETEIIRYKAPYDKKYKSPGKGGAFKIVLGAFEDLRNLYGNYQTSFNVGSGSTKIYIGEYTNQPRLAKRIHPTVPIYYGNMVRPRTLHTIRDSQSRILVRLYTRMENGKQVYYKYPLRDKEAPAGTGLVPSKPSLTSNTTTRKLVYPSAEALAELDRLIAEGERSNITLPMSTADVCDLSKAWMQDSDGKWYYGGNFNSNQSIKTAGRTYWLEFDPTTKELFYYKGGNKAANLNSTKATINSTQYYHYTATFSAATTDFPATTWTGYYVWAHGGFHDINNGGSEFRAPESYTSDTGGLTYENWDTDGSLVKNWQIAWDTDSAKVRSAFVLYGDKNPDLDMLVPPEKEPGETDTAFAARQEEYQKKYELFSKHVEGVYAITVGRPFLWQEMMGFSVGKRDDNHEPDTIAGPSNKRRTVDGKQTEGSDFRTFFRKNEKGERITCGFDEVYQAVDVDSRGQRVWYQHPLAGKYNDNLAEVSPGYLQDRNDPIRVFNPKDANWKKARLEGYDTPLDAGNQDITTHRTMDDFLYEVDFGKDALGQPIKRQAVNVLAGFEDTENGDYDYGDLMFSVYVAPEVKRQAQGVDVLSKSAMQWWERDEREGLTGYVSHTPVTVNNHAAGGDAVTPSILSANYARLGYLHTYQANGAAALAALDARTDINETEKANLRAGLEADFKEGLVQMNSQFWSMREPDGTNKFTTFPRAVFTFNSSGYSNAILDTKTKEAEAWIKKCLDELNITRPPFFFTDDDIMDHVQWVLVDDETWEKHKDEYFDQDTGKLLKDVVIQSIQDNNPAYDLQYIDLRWGEKEKEYYRLRTALTNGATAADGSEPENGEAPAPSSLGVTKEDVLIRRIAAQVIGSETLEVLGMKTVSYSAAPAEAAAPGEDTPPPTEPEVTNKAFLPGEPRLAYDPEQPDMGNYPYNGGDKSATIEHRQDEMVFTDLDASGNLRKGKVMQFMADGADTSAVVAKMYTDYFTDSEFKSANDAYRTMSDRNAMWDKFGMKDRRFVIGYHRGGNYAKFSENNPTSTESTYLQDRYEVVSLGRLAWNPFRSTLDEKYLANNLQNPGAAADVPKRYEYEFKYGSSTSGVPQFVFDKAIDGAGAMVVNGDLVVKDTFAYHGVLVVLGDVIIEPTLKKDQFLWAIDGWPLDRLGNSCHPVDSNREYEYYEAIEHDANGERKPFGDAGKWKYYPNGPKGEPSTVLIGTDGKESIVDEPGSPYYKKPEPVLPLRRDEYRGELIIQGQLIVKGRIITKEVTDEKTGQIHRGVLNAYWSKEAVESTAGIWALGENVIQRISWNHNDDINVRPIWDDQLDSPSDYVK